MHTARSIKTYMGLQEVTEVGRSNLNGQLEVHK